MTYSSKVYDVSDLQAAKDIIVTPRDGLTSDERWEHETAVLADLLIDKLEITRSSIVLDFGCGAGRMAKALIDRTHCIIYGVDQSMKMLWLANEYVMRRRFKPVHYDLFKHLVNDNRPTAHPIRFDCAFAIWVMQHVQFPLDELNLIHTALKPGGSYLQFGEAHRCVPQEDGSWLDDEINVWALGKSIFDVAQDTSVDFSYKSVGWALWRK